MRNRTVLILELINNPCPDDLVIQQLAALGPHCDQPVATLSRTGFLTILKRFESGTLSAPELKAWATRLAGRRDIEFEFGPEGAVEEALFWLMYEEIQDWTSHHLCQHIETLLERRGRKRDAP
jgi:hypothetical protein